MELVLISDEKKLFEGTILELNSNTQEGPLTILDNHISYISKIKDFVSFTTSEHKKLIHDISEGFLYTNGTVCFAVVE